MASELLNDIHYLDSIQYLERLFLWAVFYSFLGWVYESILVSVQERRPVNRGFLNGPLCPIYGAGAALAIVVLTPLKDVPAAPAVMFMLGALGASVLEYVTSWAMERIFHARWWDYSHFRFNINGRVCLIGAIVFGVFGIIIVDVTQPWVEHWTDMIPTTAFHILVSVLFVACLSDFIVTVVGFSGFHRRLAEFARVLERGRERMADGVNLLDGVSLLDVSEALQQYTDAAAGRLQTYRDAATGKVRRLSENLTENMPKPSVPSVPVAKLYGKLLGALNFQQRRMLSSFPRMTSDEYGDLIKKLREKLVRK
ncbi:MULTISPECIES: putative ABC transporter permease [Bifidobacterium]|uniref:putative ABC transporter permease n=1 Tax=Bifidobacterium TaxID=1678 RepID=UPI0017837A69|nr:MULTISPECIES: putative ABC transporter permease [Bifidobacterium]